MKKLKATRARRASPVSPGFAPGARVRVTAERSFARGCEGASHGRIEGDRVLVQLDHKHAPSPFPAAQLEELA